MSLLRDIQEAAGNFNTPLQVALHHCMILADRLGPTPFKEWVEEELSGYPVGAKLPAYRRIRGVASIGNFGGPLGAKLNNIPLPVGPIPAHLRDRYTTIEFREGIAQLEEMASGKAALISPWPEDLVASVATMRRPSALAASDVYLSMPRLNRCGTRPSTSRLWIHGPPPSWSPARYISVFAFSNTGCVTTAS